MLNINFIGRLGADAEIKTTEKGNKFLEFRVAVNDFNNREKTTTWVRVTDFSDRAIKLAQYLKKGSAVSVHGTLHSRPYSDKNGVLQVGHDVSAFNIEFASLGGQQQDNEKTANTENTVPTNVVEVATCGTLKRPETVQITSPSVAATSGDADEDLPF